jgi:hypothetical protein
MTTSYTGTDLIAALIRPDDPANGTNSNLINPTVNQFSGSEIIEDSAELSMVSSTASHEIRFSQTNGSEKILANQVIFPLTPESHLNCQLIDALGLVRFIT